MPDVTVESSPTEILKMLTPVQNKTWRETGKLPEPETEKTESSTVDEKIEAKQESAAPADKESTGEEVKTPTEEAAKSAPAAKEPELKARTAARIQTLLDDNKRLRKELEAVQKAPVAAPAKIEEVAKPRRTDVDEKTGLPKYATDEAFDTAYETYLTTKVTKDVEARNARMQAEARQREQNNIQQQRWQNSIKLAVERYPDFAKVCEVDDKGAFQNAELKSIKERGTLDAFCLDSEIGAQILYHLAKNKGEVARIDGMNAFMAARELTRLEDRLLAQSADDSEVKEGSSTEKKVSSAPAPAAKVGGRATAPVDETEAAIKAGDFRRFKKAADEEEFRKKRKA